jgi:peptide/nickel transport system permease protein
MSPLVPWQPLEQEAAPAAPPAPSDPLVRVEDLRVTFGSGSDAVHPVDGVSLELGAGEIVGVVGESGSGKSMLALALAQLVPHPGHVSARRLEFDGLDLPGASRRERQRKLGTGLAVVFQNPMSSLNPALRVRTQLTEAVRAHGHVGRAEAAARAEARLADVHIPSPRTRLLQYPHELSGGMRQRVMIAMGMMHAPKLIVADEPTTALDVTVQAQVLALLRELNREHGAAILLISHDIGVISALARRVLVMYAGRIVEDAPLETIRRAPAHPYTRALLAAVPTLAGDRDAPLASIPGRIPPLDALPAGCAFAPRCPHAQGRCRLERPPLGLLGPAHAAACWPALEHAGVVEPEPRREIA